MAWNTKTKIFGMPLISIGVYSYGIISIGWVGTGIITISQFGMGIISINQMGMGIISINQIGIGVITAGQVVFSLFFGIGQVAIAFIAFSPEIETSIGYYSHAVTSFSDIIAKVNKVIILIDEEPSPLIIWGASWIILFTFLYLQRNKIRLKMQFIDLFRSKFKHSNFNVRLNAVKSLHDINKLKEIALNDKSNQVKCAAINKIDDDEFLTQIILNNQNQAIVSAALNKIKNQNTLVKILKGSLPKKFRKNIIKIINDQKLLYEILLYGTDKKTTSIILKKINDVKILKDIVSHAQLNEAKIQALQKINDIQFILDIEKNYEIEVIRLAAKRKMAKYRPKYSRMKIKIDCPYCSQPVFLTGSHLETKCTYCMSEIPIPVKFWKEVFAYAFEKSFFGIDFYGFRNVDFKGGEKNPRCIECQKKLPLNITDLNISYITCKSCGTENNIDPAPEWSKKFYGKKNEKKYCGKPEIVFCTTSEIEKDKKNKGMKPVAISCIKCGGTLEITPGTPRNTTCKYCDTKQYLPDPLWLSIHPVPKKQEWYIRWAPLEKMMKI